MWQTLDAVYILSIHRFGNIAGPINLMPLLKDERNMGSQLITNLLTPAQLRSA